MLPRNKLVLASRSPRRKALLGMMQIPFETCSASTSETFSAEESLDQNLVRIATEKAEAARSMHPEQTAHAIVLGADTTVVLDGKPRGKPADFTEAHRMLTHLQGRSHEVITGFCLLHGLHHHAECVTTTVEFAPMNEEEITHYITTQQPYDKAGAYGIQDPLLSCFVKAVRGCYYNVVGLPLSAVYTALKQFSPTQHDT
ncbi:septum formation protein Maf [Prosthecochloris sp. N3]|uniref:dTTP/UTP pyrophosphatase n=1 Tax=Prosthecochloris ethylica TaxID=2743976 RepID=A0ABR9XSA1_9CHLB|nr:Maf family protein [Prosthecochloris ethylica]MBF0585385.1 septum formation protein Maf [Prosthecochloris ethylica]MBF0636921.1 septum formation protein Maf [Prosthecochloris ethylica]NUK46614.1 septum formation protein Maf [Prosthecochloris ethylica]